MISGFEKLTSDAKLAKLKEIADILSNTKWQNNVGRSLLYGSSGIALFLMKYWKLSKNDRYYKAASTILVDSYDYLTHQTLLQIHKPQDVDLRFDTGLSGIAWSLMYLQKHKFIDCQFDDILITLDCHIFRLMIDGIHSKQIEEIRGAVEVTFYALERNTHLAREYLARFIRESESIMKGVEDRTTQLLYGYFYTQYTKKYPEQHIFNNTYSPVSFNELLSEYDKKISSLIDSVRIDFPYGNASCWMLPSNHTFQLHPGIHNGLSGIGLSLMAGIVG